MWNTVTRELHHWARWLFFLFLWAGGIVVIASDILRIAPRPEAAHYSPVFLLLTVTLWLFYVAIQYLARRQVEYLLSSISLVMFVQAFTALITLLARSDILVILQLSKAQPPPLLVLVILSVGTSILLGLVTLQTMTLSGGRTYIERKVDAYMDRWKDHLGQNGLSRMLAVKELAPLDLGGPEPLRRINSFYELRRLISNLLPDGVPPEEREAFLNDISGVHAQDSRGIDTGERLRGAGHISWYLGMSASVVGSWVIVFGSLFI